jgi:hypothetical protein
MTKQTSEQVRMDLMFPMRPAGSGFGPIIQGGSVDVQKPALVGNAQAGLIGVYYLLSLFRAYRLSFLDKKLRSTFNRPIFL